MRIQDLAIKDQGMSRIMPNPLPLSTAITMRSQPSSPDPAQFPPSRNHEIAILGPDTYYQVEILV